MRLKKNKTIVEGTVERVEPSADGWGATAEFKVDSAKAAAGYDDFLQAAPGSTISVFVPEPGMVQAGRSLRLTISVHGGPTGERVVVESAETKKP